jgi:hypothetical protein
MFWAIWGIFLIAFEKFLVYHEIVKIVSTAKRSINEAK